MSKLRSSLNPEEQPYAIEGPTPFKCDTNGFPLVCSICAGTFYVDGETSRRVSSVIADGLDNPFCCEECEADLDEEARGR